MTRVLLIEDSRSLAFGLQRHLEHDGYTVEVAYSGGQGLRAARRGNPDAIVLDLMLPDVDGFEVLRSLRGEGSAIPVLVLTARDAEEDVLKAFTAGADDYVRKPARVRELLARLRVILRRAGRGRPEQSAPARDVMTIRFGDVEIDGDRCVVTRNGRPVELRPKEYDLLLALARRRGAVVSRAELLREVWGYAPMVQSRTVDTHVLELRRKLEREPDTPVHILTIRTRGYRLQLSEASCS